MARSVGSLVGWVVTSAGLIAACNAISGLDEDYQLGTFPSEGGAEASSGSSGDGSLDGPSNDAPEPDASGPFRCPASAPDAQLFCDDFEGNVPWTRSETTPMGSPLVVEDAIGANASRGLRAHANMGSQSRKVARWQTVALSFDVGTSIKLAFRFKLNTAGLNYFVVGAIQVNEQSFGNAEYGLAVYKSCPTPPSPCLDENNPQGETNNHAFGDHVSFTVGQWYDATVIVRRDSSTSYVGTVSVDGETTPLQTVDTNGTTYFSGNPTKVEIGVGVFYSGTDNGLDAEAVIDDVVVTTQ